MSRSTSWEDDSSSVSQKKILAFYGICSFGLDAWEKEKLVYPTGKTPTIPHSSRSWPSRHPSSQTTYDDDDDDDDNDDDDILNYSFHEQLPPQLISKMFNLQDITPPFGMFAICVI